MRQRLVAVALALSCASLAPANQPRPVEGTAYVETTDYGRLPAEIIFPTDNRVMVLVPAGSYTIGLDNPRERGFSSDEGPAVQVELGTYYIDKHEVTRAAYLEFARARGAALPRDNQGTGGAMPPESPVTAISYFDALSYAEHHRKDLPTEAEWEVAARGPEAWLYPWGNEPDPAAALVGAGINEFPKATGLFPRDTSPFGAMDMAGGVSEWAKDDYLRDYYARSSGQRNPLHQEYGETTTVRGGNYFMKGDGRATERTPGTPTNFREEIGFRTVFRLRPPPAATPVPVASATPRATPSRAERMRELLDTVRPLFASESPQVPVELVAPPMRTQLVPLWNQTASALRTGLLDVDNGHLVDFPRVIAAGAYESLPVPQGRIVQVVAFPTEGWLPEAKALGPASSGSAALMIVTPEMVGPMVEDSGAVREPLPDQQAMQLYSAEYQVPWMTQTVSNTLDQPVEVTARLVRVSGPAMEVVRSETRVLDSGQTTQFTTIAPGTVEVLARYVGSQEEHTCIPVTYENQPGDVVRLFVLRPSEDANDTVAVFARRLPRIAIQRIDSAIPEADKRKFIAR